ncbi:hypothetical protein G352_22161 [Rhodococcus ruber BKS 20-38]|uniref:NIPSNAP domain-containing protein n=1 Tax=Rhodococcus ruber BKS 20-38 TaxID=1278076 RepID=M2Z6F7_9NOCA|nr:NIPSNAP family protein [Rhodococcus ruber]EME56239.1 hypothetical protein G352_22161 [Rhodococcus ruber BKS 20-38]
MNPDRPGALTGEDQAPDVMAVRFEWTTVKFALVNQIEVMERIDDWAWSANDGGQYLGGWIAENGRLGQIWVLRRFAGIDPLLAARDQQRRIGHPLSHAESIQSISVETFAAFSFLPMLTVGSYGPAYEIRDYRLVPGGLPATIAGWRTALPRRHSVDPITVVMYALDGVDRIVHIWPFASPNDRVAKRKQVYDEKIWPPPGAPEMIAEADSTMAWPLPRSPLQ